VLDKDREQVEKNYKSEAREIGIELDEIRPNPGLRNIAKLFLNAFYGKFGQALNYTQKKYIRSSEELYTILLDKKLDSINIQFPNNNLAYVSYKLKEEFVKNNYITNLYIAIKTAAYGRIKLFEVLEKVGEDALYVDTDSILYEENEHTKQVLKQFCGKGLGKLDEDNLFEGGYCIKFSSIGPKQINVEYVDRNGILKEVGKQRGHCYNFNSQQTFNLQNNVDVINAYVKGNDVDKLAELTDRNKIKSTEFKIRNMKIFTTEMVKQFLCSYDKRMVHVASAKEINSLPFGY
jgi:hypothetical protein